MLARTRPSFAGSHHGAALVLFLRLLVEHLRGEGEVGGLVHQVVQLLPPRQHGVDGLVQHDLGLVELALDPQDLIRLVRVLVHLNGRRECLVTPRVISAHRLPRVPEPVHVVVAHLAQDAERGARRVLLVHHRDGHQAPAVADVDQVLVLLHALSLPGLRPLHDGAADEREHLPHAAPLEVAELVHVLGLTQARGLLVVAVPFPQRERGDLHHRRRRSRSLEPKPSWATRSGVSPGIRGSVRHARGGRRRHLALELRRSDETNE
mmetsp:Transcript_1911/g.8000  ORF Transcript_1911/g.8000 Transcript_1911/m.8000 type:complete len:264 (+) Transcript_1911:1099-1890(+)